MARLMLPLSNIAKIGLITVIMIVSSLVTWSVARQPEVTLEIRTAREGLSLPDGFYVWHHLDANGIAFKSITPKQNGLMIHCMTSIQCEAARNVLTRNLPQGYVMALRETGQPG